MIQDYINFFDNKTNISIYILIMASLCVFSMLVMRFKNNIDRIINIPIGLALVMLLILSPYLFYMLKVIFGLLPTIMAILLFSIYLVMLAIKAYGACYNNR